ncbi:MAG: retropepsin-like domain-containing protein [Prevotellaceae bacterium]|jgi:predicted aspartyl protease|nr:retropepsin-like domain-containing protein [Prevotellaceae bacterium]
MRKVFLSICILLFAQCVFAQETTSGKNVIKAFVECINTKSATKIEPLLDENFEMTGYQMPVSLKISHATVNQLNTTVDSALYIENTKKENGYIAICDAYFSNSKKRAVSFTYNPQDELKEISIEGVGTQTKKQSELSINTDNAPDIINIPFTLLDKLPVVKVKVDGKEQNFIFDSGAPSIVLNSKYYTKNDSNQSSITTSKGVAGNKMVNFTKKIASFEFADLKGKDMEVMASDLSQLEKRKMPIHGLIGYAIIKDFDVIYDYAEKTITLVKKDYTKEYIDLLSSQQKVSNIVPMKQIGHIPYVTMNIDTKEYIMGIDCGASSNLITDKRLDELQNAIKRTKTTKLMGGDTKGVKKKSGKIKKLEIGDLSFKNTPTIFSNIDHLNAAKDVNLDGLIGYPILSKYKCIVSYHTNSLIFLLN